MVLHSLSQKLVKLKVILKLVLEKVNKFVFLNIVLKLTLEVRLIVLNVLVLSKLVKSMKVIWTFILLI